MGRRPWEAMARSCDGLKLRFHVFRCSKMKYEDCGPVRTSLRCTLHRGTVWPTSLRLHIQLGNNSFSASGKHWRFPSYACARTCD